mgnify:CR=1 FL=1
MLNYLITFSFHPCGPQSMRQKVRQAPGERLIGNGLIIFQYNPDAPPRQNICQLPGEVSISFGALILRAVV